MLSIFHGWVPPSRENWQLTVNFYQYVFPVFGSFQWFLKWYGMGKTSVASSPLNIPGRAAWLTMEIVGPAVFLTSVLSAGTPLPWRNGFLAGLYLLHYAYRAVAFPLLQPSMSPIHLLVWSSAVVHQFCNGTSLGGWLGPHGPSSSPPTSPSSTPSSAQFLLGVTLFLAGLAGNFYHDEALRDIRRREARRQRALRNQPGVDRRSRRGAVDKHYRVPEAGLFRLVLYPHYLCEWAEWLGFWLACGWACAPARAFFLNEVFAMLPRAVNGRRWYADKFGEDKIRGRWAVIPGLI